MEYHFIPLTNSLAVKMQIWAFGKYFPKDELSELITLEKIIGYFY
jgi:hypothetical protein